jgi:Chalcone isomerase-like
VQRRPLVIAALAAVASTRVHAAAAPPAEVGKEWPQARLVGSGRLRFLGLAIYDARLWAPAGALPADDWLAQAFALELNYLRKLVGRQIAERSLQEMQRQAEISPPQAERWLAELSSAFPDVQAGDRLTGLYRPGEAATVYFNGRRTAEWRDAELARRFFAIWLDRGTSQPGLREALLGGRR